MIREISADEMPMLDATARRYHGMIDIGEYDGKRFAQTWGAMIELGMALVVVDEDDSGVQGAIGVVIAPCPSTVDTLATVAFWYVNPEVRGLRGARLLLAVEQIAASRGAHRVSVALTETAQTDKIAASLERRGYGLFERIYSRRLIDTLGTNDANLATAEYPEGPSFPADLSGGS